MVFNRFGATAVALSALAICNLRCENADKPERAAPPAANQTSQTAPQPSAARPQTAPSRYWIGVLCEPLEPAAREQLHLPKDEGLVVLGFAVNGPAVKAGIRLNDLLLTAGDNPLRVGIDLTSAVEHAADKALKLVVVRDGKRIEISVRPERRPPEPATVSASGPNDREIIDRWLNQFGTHVPLADANGLTVVRPGAGLLVPSAPSPARGMPDDMSVDIYREGKKPAEITVKKGSQVWKTTENNLDALPPAVRQQVEPLLHAAQIRITFRAIQIAPPSATGQASQSGAAGAAGDQGSGVRGQRQPAHRNE